MRGHQNNVRNEEGSQSQKTEQAERRPRARPHIYNEGTNGVPKDIDYFKKYCIYLTKPQRDELRLTQLKDLPEILIFKSDIIF